ncbi:MAG: hypothetical protein WCT04_24365 [Planctomycetota bacterium]
MAKSDVTVRMSAENAQFVQEQLKARDAILATADASRKMGEKVVKAGDSVQDLFSPKNLAKIASATGAYDLMKDAISGALKVLQDLTAQEEKRGKKANERVGGLSDALGGVGQLDRFPHLNQVANSIKTTAFDASGVSKILATAISKTNGERTEKEYINATIEAVKATEAGLAPDKAGGFAANLLQVEKMTGQKGGGWENLSDKDKSNMAFEMTRMAPDGLSPQDAKLLGRSKDKNLGFALLEATNAAGEEGEAGGKIQQLAGYVPSNEELKKFRHPKKLNEEEKAKKAIWESGATEEERIMAMMRNPEMVGIEPRGMVRNVSRKFDINAALNVLENEPLQRTKLEHQELMKDPAYAAMKGQRDEDVKTLQLDDVLPIQAAEKNLKVSAMVNQFRKEIIDSPWLAETLVKPIAQVAVNPTTRAFMDSNPLTGTPENLKSALDGEAIRQMITILQEIRDGVSGTEKNTKGRPQLGNGQDK